MKITIPELSLVVLVGASGSGKSTFAARHFKSTETLSSDFCRGLVGDDENDQTVSDQAFEVLHVIAAKRLALGRLTVVDATNVQPEWRKPLVELAREYHVLPVAVVFNLPERISQLRNAGRPDRTFGPHVVRHQASQLRRSLRSLDREGFRRVFVLRSQEEVDLVEVLREPSWTNRAGERGPFDIIGDVHGCFDELAELLQVVGYEVDTDRFVAHHPGGRKAVFLGDLVDRGPNMPGVLRLVMNMVASDHAICVPGNHENKLVRALKGRDVQVTHGLAESLEQLGAEPPEFSQHVAEFLDGLVSPSSWTRDDWSWRMRACGRRCRGGPPARCGRSPYTARPRERPTSSGCRFAIRGPLSIGGVPRSCTATRRPHRPSGSTTRSASTPLRVRRRAHRPPLPGARAGQRASPPDVLRAGPTAGERGFGPARPGTDPAG